MNKKEAKNRIEELRKQVEYHAKRYYDDDEPEISDFEYDMLMVELRNLEKKFPEFNSKESLTQKVGGHVKEGFEKVTHEVPLQSLQDVFSIDEVKEYVQKIEEKAIENDIENNKYVVETKIDGLSAALEYKNGKFVKGATRGNGLVGEDVTENLKTVKTIPMQLNENIDITVRGEVFISKQDFEKMNQEREENEEELFANARNAATRKIIIGKKPCIPCAECSTKSATNTFAPRRFVIPDSVHAKVRIIIGAIIDLNPSGIHSVNSWKVRTSLII